jgi:hypothetical protein
MYLDRVSLDAAYRNRMSRVLGMMDFTRKVVSGMGKYNQTAREMFQGWGQRGGDGGEAPFGYWRDAEDVARIEEYQKWGDLFKGNHETHLRPEWLPSGKSEYKRVNLCRFISTTYADLMLGGGAEIRTGSAVVDLYLENSAELADYFYTWQLWVSVYGMIGVQVIVDERSVDVVKVKPEFIYVKWEDSSDDDFKWISKKLWVDPEDLKPDDDRWSFNKNGEENDGVIFEERHYRGRIEYYLYVVKEDGIMEMLPPHWYVEELPEVDEDSLCQVDTGIDEFMLVILPNLIFDREFVSDYRDVEDQIRDINTRSTQLNRVLNMHADPKLMLPESMRQVDPYSGRTIVTAQRDEVLFLSEEDEVTPQYLTWDAHIDAAYSELKNDLNMLCTIAKISPSLIVTEQGSMPEAAAAFKLKLTPTLNHVKQKSTAFRRALRKLVWVFIQKLHQEGLFTCADTEDAVQGLKDGAPGRFNGR